MSGRLVLTEIEVSERLYGDRSMVRTLQRWRQTGESGLPYVMLGTRRVGYMVTDVEAWLTANRVASTSAATVRRGRIGV